MKFDVVVGNPPYNNDIYIPFVEMGHNLASQCSVFITPARWKNSMDNVSNNFRKKIEDKISKLVFYPDCYDIFAIRIVSGITYYIINKSEVNECIVKNKCVAHKEFNTEISRELKGYKTPLLNFGYEIVKKINIYKELVIADNMCDEYHVNINKQVTVSGGGFATREKGDDGHWHVKSDVVGKYSMLFSKTDNNMVVVGNPQIIKTYKDIIFEESGFSIFSSNKLEECQSFSSYIECKLIKFLLFIAISKTACMHKQETWRFVPDPGTFDHIFTDEELYKKYNLTPEEINIIESVIKERK